MAKQTGGEPRYIVGSAVRKPVYEGGTAAPVRRTPRRPISELERKRRQEIRRRSETLKERRLREEERALAREKRAERLEKKQELMNLPSLVAFVAASFVLFAFCFNYIQLQTEMNSRISAIERKKQTLEQLRAENDALRNSIDTSINPNEIYRIATQELGMVYAGEGQVITYDKTESEYVRQYESIPQH